MRINNKPAATLSNMEIFFREFCIYDMILFFNQTIVGVLKTPSFVTI